MKIAIPAAMLAALAVAGCTEDSASGTSSATTDAARDYAQMCAACHGPAGKGDGIAGKAMTPPATDLTVLAQANGGKFPFLSAMQRIDGHTMGASDAHMPAYDELRAGPTVMFDAGDGHPVATPARMVAMLRYLETLQGD